MMAARLDSLNGGEHVEHGLYADVARSALLLAGLPVRAAEVDDFAETAVAHLTVTLQNDLADLDHAVYGLVQNALCVGVLVGQEGAGG